MPSNTWGNTTWGGGLWAIPSSEASTPGTGVGRILVTAEADASMPCVVDGTLTQTLEDGWLQHDTLSLTVQDVAVPAAWTPHALLTASQQVIAPNGSIVSTQDYGRYRLIVDPGLEAHPGRDQRSVSAEDWLRAKLLRPYSQGMVAYANPPVTLLALLWALTGVLPANLTGAGDLTDPDLISTGTTAFGGQAGGPLIVTWDGPTSWEDGANAPVWINLDTAAGDGSAPLAQVIVTQRPPLLDPPVTFTFQVPPLDPSLTGTDTLKIQMYSLGALGTGYVGPELLLSVDPGGTPSTTTVSATDGSVTLTASNNGRITGSPWMNTWEGAIFALLWWLTGSTAAAPWVTVDGALASGQDLLPIGADPANITFGATFAAVNYVNLQYDLKTTWKDFLAEFCRVPDALSRMRWGMHPLTITYDAQGVLHMRRTRERWGQGWGWSTDPARPAAVPMRIQVPLRETHAEPRYDHLKLMQPAYTIYYVSQDGSGGAVYTPVAVPPLVIAERIIDVPWAPYDADWERLLEVTLTTGSFSATSIGADPTLPISGVTLPGQALDALVQQYAGAARTAHFTLTRPWYYVQLGQEVTLRYTRVTDVHAAYRVTRTVTPLRGGLGTWDAQWAAEV